MSRGAGEGQPVTLEGRIKRLERERDHPAHPGPETVELWASLFTNAGIGIEESRAKAAALEFLGYCQSTAEKPTIAALNKWAHCQTEV